LPAGIARDILGLCSTEQASGDGMRTDDDTTNRDAEPERSVVEARVADRAAWPCAKKRLGDSGDHAFVRSLSVEERIAMVEELTADAWAWREDAPHESRLRRDVVRVVRSGR
jgi:hypothetical protein